MLRDPYQYVMELYKQDGAKLGRTATTVDWEPAREWTRFSAIRRGKLPQDETGGAASIHPLWHPDAGEPYLGGFRVGITRNGCEVTADFTTSYFASRAREASAYFVQRGRLQEGEHFKYFVTAYPRRDTPEPGTGLTGEEAVPAISYRETRLSEFLGRAVPSGTVDSEDMPVFFPQDVLEEVRGLTSAVQGTETGGFLIGCLHRDAGLPEIFAEVTAQIPAQAQGDTTKLRLTPETWTAGRAALKLRNRGEIFLGYWHSHPVKEWCKQSQCSLDKLRTCALARDYFSEEDQAVLRAAFPRAYSLGLVVNDAPLEQMSISLFGWKQGLVASRGYYVLQR